MHCIETAEVPHLFESQVPALKNLSPPFRRIILASIYLFYLVLLLEVFSRAYWVFAADVPFFHPKEIFYTFYPGLKEISQEVITREDEYFDILLLGGSVLYEEDGDVEQILLEKLTYATKQKIRIFNLSVRAHTSLDSYLKYQHLQGQFFDLVIFYHGVNDLRANNIPPDLYRDDYSHFSWYQRIYELDRHPELNFLTFPYTFVSLKLRLGEYFGSSTHAPINEPLENWLIYGKDLKTAPAFEKNLRGVLALAAQKGDPVLLMSFASYLPEDYTRERFDEGLLDYTLQEYAIELWGLPEVVPAGIEAHNAITERLAEEYGVSFVDQNLLMPKRGEYFNDLVHFTVAGSNAFVENMLPTIIQLISNP